jgi:hypothetical protein
VMKKIKKIERAASRWWYLVVGIHWYRMQWRIGAFYYQRVCAPWVFWRACGSPPQWVPARPPWWAPFVLAWLRITGHYRR